MKPAGGCIKPFCLRRDKRFCHSRKQDHILVIKWRITERQRAGGIALECQFAFRGIADCAVATVAIIEIELREQTLAAKFWPRKQIGLTPHRFCLTNRPEPHAIGARLALHIICILVVMLLKRAEQVEFK